MLERVIEIIAEQLNVDASTITEDTSFKDDSIVFIPSFCNVRSNSRYLVPLKGV